MTFEWGAIIGLFLGFAFGVGCALAVMYSIFMGGYRAALRDGHAASPPERLRREQAREQARQQVRERQELQERQRPRS